MFGADPFGPRFNIVILRDSHQSGYNLGSAGPLRHLDGLQERGREQATPSHIAVCSEAGRDGFWLHRLLTVMQHRHLNTCQLVDEARKASIELGKRKILEEARYTNLEERVVVAGRLSREGGGDPCFSSARLTFQDQVLVCLQLYTPATYRSTLEDNVNQIARWGPAVVIIADLYKPRLICLNSNAKSTRACRRKNKLSRIDEGDSKAKAPQLAA